MSVAVIRTESFSSIGCFFQCNYKYKLRYILRKKTDRKSEALRRGIDLHEKIEHGVTGDNGPLDYAATFKSRKGKVKFKHFGGLLLDHDKEMFIEESESKFGLDPNGEVCDYSDSEALFRGKIDYYKAFIDKKELVKTNNLISSVYKVKLIDYKSGHSNPDKRQLNLYAYGLSKMFPNAKIECSVVMVDQQTEKNWIFDDSKTKNLEWLKSKIKRIREATTYRAIVSRLCDYCEYCGNGCDARNSINSSVGTNNKMKGVEALGSLGVKK